MGVSIHKQCSPKGIPSSPGHLRQLRHLREAKTAAEDQATKLATEEAQEEAKEGLDEKSMAVVATCQKRMGSFHEKENKMVGSKWKTCL